MRDLARSYAEPMLTEAYNGIQHFMRIMQDLPTVLTTNMQIDNVVLRAVHHPNSWTLDFQRILHSMKTSVDDLDAKVQ